MKALELISLYNDFTEKNHWERIVRSNIINDADPTAFNYSMEEPILRRFGDFFSITEPWVFSAIQPCIRTGDFGRIKSDPNDSSHLTLFHMIPIPFNVQPDQKNFRVWHKEAILRPLTFLVEHLGLDLDRIRLSYFSGGTLREVSGGRIPSDRYLPPDQDTVNFCVEYGMSPQQMIPEANPDTFLCASPVAGPFYAGNRFEFYYLMPDEKLLEIGTGEALAWRQTVSEGQAVDIEPIKGAVCLAALGLERCLTARNRSQKVSECDHVQSLIDAVLDMRRTAQERTAFLLVDALRAVHLVVSDGGAYASLNHRLREHQRTLMRRVTQSMDEMSLSIEEIHLLLKQNAEQQPWLPVLADGVDPTLSELQAYRRRQ